jgi:uncharacterized membrane protein YccC
MVEASRAAEPARLAKLLHRMAHHDSRRLTMNDGSHDEEETRLRTLRATVADLEARSRALSPSSLRHEVTNAVGAARNALVLIGENAEPEAAARFMEIVHRNVDRARQLLSGNDSASGAAGNAPSARDQRNDLGRPREGEHGDTLGL